MNHILRLDEWGSHDPLMGATLRSEVADARRSQQRSHRERLAQLKARRALRMATSAKGLHDQMRGASEAFAASAEACTPRAGGPERQAANSSSGAHAARNEKRPFAGARVAAIIPRTYLQGLPARSCYVAVRQLLARTRPRRWPR